MGLFNRFKKPTDQNEAPSDKPKKAVAKKVPVAAAAKTDTKAETKIVAKSKKPDAEKVATAAYQAVQSVLLQPLVTEKSTSTGTYYYKVTRGATKNEIRKAFNSKYGKMPRKVNVINVMGKTKMRGRSVGKRSDWKKAVIYLAKDETVELFQ